MVCGWFIYNGNVKENFFAETHKIYEESAKRKNINLVKIKNNEIFTVIENNKMKIKTKQSLLEPNFVLFMDKDIKLAYQLEQLGYKVFNSSQCINICDDKETTFQILSNNNITLPKTIFSPLTFKGTYEENNNFIEFVEKELSYPIVVKEAHGSFGWQVYLVNNKEQLIKKRNELLYVPHLYQQFIKTSKGRDIRLNVVGDKVVSSMLRVSKKDFRANVLNGSEAFLYKPSDEFIEVAIKASKLLGADFSGVDILFGNNDEPILCEVNSNAGIKSALKKCGVNVADYIFDYILAKIKI